MNKFLLRSISILVILVLASASLFAQSNSTQQFPSDLVGHWSFNNPNNLTEAEVGNALVLNGNHIAVDGLWDGENSS